jgi:hypothetical protein
MTRSESSGPKDAAASIAVLALTAACGARLRSDDVKFLIKGWNEPLGAAALKGVLSAHSKPVRCSSMLLSDRLIEVKTATVSEAAQLGEHAIGVREQIDFLLKQAAKYRRSHLKPAAELRVIVRGSSEEIVVTLQDVERWFEEYDTRNRSIWYGPQVNCEEDVDLVIEVSSPGDISMSQSHS